MRPDEGVGDGRRRFVRTVAVAPVAWMMAVPPAMATPEAMAVAMLEVVGSRSVTEGRVTVELPRIADDGNVVPLTVKVDSPMTPADHVSAIHVFSEQNPVPTVVQFFLGPLYPKAEVSTRIRLARTQRVVAVAEMNDGRCWSGTVLVDVTITACGD